MVRLRPKLWDTPSPNGMVRSTHELVLRHLNPHHEQPLAELANRIRRPALEVRDVLLVLAAKGLVMRGEHGWKLPHPEDHLP